MYKLMARSVWLKLMRKRQTFSVIIFRVCMLLKTMIHLILYKQMKNYLACQISFDYVDIVTSFKKLNINKSEIPDGIHPRVLSENAEILAYPLKIIFEKSFTLNALPLDWRSGNILLLFSNKVVSYRTRKL